MVFLIIVRVMAQVLMVLAHKIIISGHLNYLFFISIVRASSDILLEILEDAFYNVLFSML